MRRTRNIFETYGRRPSAAAVIKGSRKYPTVGGTALFFRVPGGTIVRMQIWGLPDGTACSAPVFGCHIHAGTSCTGTAEEPFADAGGHFNPHGCIHPHHAGDLPPLFGCGGIAYSEFYTDRFTPEEAVGHTVIIHRNADDFTSQPSGNSGEMMACGIIRR